MTLLEKYSNLLSRDVEKAHWNTSIKIMCSVSETNISQVFLHIWNKCKALNARIKFFIKPMEMHAS